MADDIKEEESLQASLANLRDEKEKTQAWLNQAKLDVEAQKKETEEATLQATTAKQEAIEATELRDRIRGEADAERNALVVAEQNRVYQDEQAAKAIAATETAKAETASILASNDGLKKVVADEKTKLTVGLAEFRAEKDKERAELEASLDPLRTEAATLQLTVDGNKTQIAAQESTIATNKEVIANQNNLIESGKATLETIDQNIKAKIAEFGIATSNTDRVRATEEEANKDLEGVNALIADAKAELAKTKAETSDLIAKKVANADKEATLNEREQFLQDKYKQAGIPW